MNEKIEFLIHFFVTLAKLIRPGGIKAVMTENLLLKQQLLMLTRQRSRAPRLTSFDRFLFGYLTFFISKDRLQKTSIILKPATILKFHQALVKRKYRDLYSRKTPIKPGRKGPKRDLIELIVEMKRRNPRFGYGRIAMQIYKEFGVDISRFAVARILRKNFKKLPDNDGPSWLTFIGNAKNSLWSVDLFRCESVILKSHWVMLMIDIYSRRIIGFSVHAGNPNGIAVCCMFNKIISSKTLPKYLSSDNDPLFEFHRWQANLRILEIGEIKTIPGAPTSHPFVERSIGLCRQEFLDHVLFWNTKDLAKKLSQYQKYYNETRAHSSLNKKTPNQKAANDVIPNEMLSLRNHRWKSHCHGLFNLPVAA